MRVHPIRDVRIHLFRVLKRTLAIADDVEVSEVEIRGEPGIGHVPIIKDRLPWRLLLCWKRSAVTAYPGEAAASQDGHKICPRSAGF